MFTFLVMHKNKKLEVEKRRDMLYYFRSVGFFYIPLHLSGEAVVIVCVVVAPADSVYNPGAG